MSQKHFKALAQMLSIARPNRPGTPVDENEYALYQQWLRDVSAVAGVCAEFNSNFKRDVFYTACKE